MKTNGVPKIRFKGFTDDWEQRKAGEIFKSVSDKGYTDLPVLSASQELGMILRDEIGIDIKYDESSIKNYKRVKPGQFVIHLRSFQGGFAWSDIEGITSPAYTILDYQEPEEHCSKFWKIVLTSPMFITRLETVTYGIRDGRSISLTDFSTLNLNVPSIAEQQKIGEYFSNLDNLITLHQRKCEQTNELKKFMLQKMFPKKGEKNPEIRFPGFTDDWEQRKLGEIAEFNPKSDLPDEFEYVDLESVVGTEMVFHRTENKASAPSRAQRVAKTGDVFFQTVRPYQRNNYLFSMPYENYVFSTGYAQMRPKINAAFLMCFLQTESFVQNVLDNCTGTSYPAINSSDLSNLKISLPILKSEQSKIGELISNLDHLITLHQRKCEQLKELKKFMLQNMFPKKG